MSEQYNGSALANTGRLANSNPMTPETRESPLWSAPSPAPALPWPAVSAAAVLALLSAVLLAWTTGLWVTLVIFLALIGVGCSLVMLYAAQRGRPSVDQSAASATALAALLAHMDTASAITTSSWALLAANGPYGALAGGYPVPLAWQDGLQACSQTARAHGQATANFVHQGTSWQAVCERMADGHLLWQFKLSASDQLLADFAAASRGPLGDMLTERGIALLVANLQGQIVGSSASVPAKDGMARDALLGTTLSRWLAYTDGQLRWSDSPEQGVVVEPQEATLTATDGSEAGYLIALSQPGAPAAPSAAAGHVSTDRNPPSFVDGLPLPLALTDRDGRLLYFNTAFATAVGLDTQTSAPTLYPSDLVTEDDRLALSDLVRRVGSGVSQRQMAVVHLRHQKDDAVQLTVTPIGKGGGRAGGIASLVTLSDNAERRKLEQQVAQAQKMQGIGQLAGGIAHDFNNILTAISGFCELLLQRHPPGDPSFSDINQVLTNSNRAAQLVKQLLAFSRQQTLSPVTVQVTDLLTEQLTTLQRLIGEGVQLNVQHGRDLGMVRVDPTQFYQVIMNLVVNARDAMPTGGRIALRTFTVEHRLLPKTHADLLQDQDYIGIEIADTGSGIPADVLPKIFEPFFTTKEVGKGTGLGLSTAYGIVKQSNGFIFADSTKNVGTTFSIYLPITTAAVPSDATPAKRLEVVDDLWGSGTILLVEDEDAVRAFAAKALERKGYKVLAAPSGEEALELLADNLAVVDLIVSDVVMPNMDGPAMARAARKLLPAVPIIFVSGYAEETLRQSLTDVLDTAHVSFLPKPFSLKELARAVKTVLDQTRVTKI